MSKGKSVQAAEMGETKPIPWGSIVVPTRGENARGNESEEVERLAASLLIHGQLQAIVVTNGGPKDRPYTLVCGARRMQAFELNGWTERDILATVKPEIVGDPVKRMAVNYAENAERVDISPLDQATRLHQLVHGTYPVAEGETARKVDKEEVCRTFGLPRNTLNKMLRVCENIAADVAHKARTATVSGIDGKRERARVPLRLFYVLSAIDGEGEEVAAKQMAVLDEWLNGQEVLATAGRQRRPRSDKGVGTDDADDVEETGEDEDEGKPARARAPLPVGKKIDPKRRTVAFYLRALELKTQEVTSDKDRTPTQRREEAARIEGATDTLRFLSGEIKRLPYLLEPDFKALERLIAKEEAEAQEKAARKSAAEGEA